MADEPTRATTSENWAQIRYDYEHTEKPVEEICAEHGISSSTLRNRMRRWHWTRRRTPIALEGPPPLPAPFIAPAAPPLIAPAAPPLITSAAPPRAPAQASDTEAPSAAIEAVAPNVAAAPHLAAGENAGAPGALDDKAIVPRLQSAVARVIPAVEQIVARLGAGPAHPREMERAARALAALTRTLRELNSLLNQHQAQAGTPVDYDDMPEDIDAFRLDLARRINVFVAARTGRSVVYNDKAGVGGGDDADVGDA